MRGPRNLLSLKSESEKQKRIKALAGSNNVRRSLIMSKLRSNMRTVDRSLLNVHKHTSAELEESSIVIKQKLTGGYGIYAGKDIEINSVILLVNPFVSFFIIQVHLSKKDKTK